ncbi:MAG: cobaltochelatase subunit CobN [Symploca sp. SIO2E6]|nr:cobaltochelatase subunit CobN [Symploca sp. SIO2E6]
MHRIAAMPGGWNPQAEGVIFIEQTPAPIIFLTAADTDIQTLAAATARLPSEFPAIRVANLLQLQQQLTIDTYAEDILSYSKVIILRLLGGRSYWSYGLEVLQETVAETGAALVVLPGDDHPDPDLISHSTVKLGVVNQLWRYLTEGGVENYVNALKFIADVCLGQNYNPRSPQPVPRVGFYLWGDAVTRGRGDAGTRERGDAGTRGRGDKGDKGNGEIKGHFHSPIPNSQFPIPNSQFPIPNSQTTNNQQPTTNNQQPTTNNKIAILFYRAHYLAGNTAPIDALCQALVQRQLVPVPVFVSSVREADVQAELLTYFQPQDGAGIRLLLNTTSFSLARLETETPQLDFWQGLDVPVLQVIFSGGTVEQWSEQFQGLTPRDTAMNVALPEVDGRIISRAVSFKSVQTWNSVLETDVVAYEPVRDRIEFVADLAANWLSLQQTPPAQRRVALILANYPNRDGRLANGVGLDTPASCIEILKALQEAGYQVDDIPANGDELIARLTAGVTNDPEGRELRQVNQQLSVAEYQQYFATLPPEVQQGICDRWQGRWGDGEMGGWGDGGVWEDKGDKEDKRRIPNSQFPIPNSQFPIPNSQFPIPNSQFPIPGIQLGNIFIGIQPSRGYDLDPSLNYHAPDLEPTPAYLAFYHWLRVKFGAQAVVHVGKHGNLEWLPGKSVALSGNCYPEVALGAMPHLYPFIVNDPGEGSQAKRRAQGVIIDHLTPPMTRAELYGPLQKLEGLIDEYYEAQSLDPSRLPIIRDRIVQLILEEHLHQDLGINQEVDAGTRGVGDAGTRGGGDAGTRGRGDAEKVNLMGTAFKGENLVKFESLILNSIDGYLCELKEAQIRDGLHILGQCPQGRQLRDLIVAIARHPGNGRIGLTRALAKDWGLDFDPLIGNGEWGIGNGEWRMENGEWGMENGEWGMGNGEQEINEVAGGVSQNFTNNSSGSILLPFRISREQDAPTTATAADLQKWDVLVACRTTGDLIEILEQQAATLVEQLILNSKFPNNQQQTTNNKQPTTKNQQQTTNNQQPTTNNQQQTTNNELQWISDRLLPALQQTNQEITQLLRGLDGRYIASGPAGAPTRGRPEVLPTGRNFYSVDIRAIPTETAWDVGRKAAEVLIERYTQENGEYPQTLGLSVWGTSTMRTGGDDLAEALALLGVQPVWDGPSRRVVDFEILPVSVLGRPRVDVTLRISGFFRDAFPNLISLFDQAVRAVAALDEPKEENPIASQVQQEQVEWEAAGLSKEEAEMRSLYRVFGSKPGAYGAGLQGLIEAQNWKDEQDLARAYINWSSYAYTDVVFGRGENSVKVPLIMDSVKVPLIKGDLGGSAPTKGGLNGVPAAEAFEQRLQQMQIVLHNQDNREHDLLDSDDYYQFQGGLTVAVRALTGKNPQTYFGDNSIPQNPRVRQLQEEIARVYRSRVVNPKWIEGVMRHGYKGAFEMAATVDYLFAYDATTNCVADHMYQGVAQAYVLNPKVQEFIQQKNPWALRDMAERLLEAHQRSLWQSVEQDTLEELRAIVLQAEAVIEGKNF